MHQHPNGNPASAPRHTGLRILGAMSLLLARACAGGGAGPGDVEPAPAAAPAAAAAGMPAGVTPALIAEGQELYLDEALCASCHAEDGTGSGIGPDITDGEWIHIDGSFDSILQIIIDGVEVPQASMIPMPPMGGGDITEAQARAVAAYVWSLTNG